MDAVGSLIESLESNEAVVVATVVGPGDLPSDVIGRRLISRADGSTYGSLGAASLNDRAVEEARGVDDATPPVVLALWELTPEEGQAMGLAPGSELQVFIETISPPQRFVVVGAGHIAQPLAKLGKMLGFHTTVLDDRPEFANEERFPDADQVIVGPYEEELSRLEMTPNTYVVLVTRGHVQDENALRQVITGDQAYLGMIGSKRRVRGVLQRVSETGVPQDAIDRVYSPIGLDIGAETPEEIAVSIMAEVTNVRRRGVRHTSSLSNKDTVTPQGSA